MTVLTTSSLWMAGLLLLGAGTAAVDARHGRRPPPLHARAAAANNEVAGFKFATVGVLYAVLLAFAVLVVWEKLNEAEGNVALEAGAATAIFRLADGMEPAPAAEVHAAIVAYVDAADRRGLAGDGSAAARARRRSTALGDVYRALLRYEPVGRARAGACWPRRWRQLDTLTQARRARIVVAEGIVPGVIWFTLFVGAVVTIGFTFFFGTENLRAQALMTGALAILIFSGLLVIIAIDRPFAGTVRVEPRAAGAGARGLRPAREAAGERDRRHPARRGPRGAGGGARRRRAPGCASTSGCSTPSWSCRSLAEAADGAIEPQVYDLSDGRFVLAFDRDERMAAFLDAPVALRGAQRTPARRAAGGRGSSASR